MSEENNKPPFDEKTLDRVLEAAYVLQEHNRAKSEREQRGRELSSQTLKTEPVRPERKPVASAPAAAAAASAARSEPRRVRRKSPTSKEDYTVVLAQIVETQHQIQVQRLDLDCAMAFIVDRAVEIAGADGAAIGILEGGNLRYRAASGDMVLPVGTEVLMEKSLSAACLRIGQVLRCADVNP